MSLWVLVLCYCDVVTVWFVWFNFVATKHIFLNETFVGNFIQSVGPSELLSGLFSAVCWLSREDIFLISFGDILVWVILSNQTPSRVFGWLIDFLFAKMQDNNALLPKRVILPRCNPKWATSISMQKVQRIKLLCVGQHKMDIQK